MPWNWQRIDSEHAAPYSYELEAALAGITYEVLEVSVMLGYTGVQGLIPFTLQGSLC